MGYALYKLSKEDAAIFVKLTEKCWNGKERDLSKLNKYERAVLLKLMDEAGEYKPGAKPVKKYNKYHDPKTGRFTSAPGGSGGSKTKTVVIDGIEVPDIMVNSGHADVYVATMKRKQIEGEIKAVLKPHVKVDLSGMEPGLMRETADTVKRTVEKYPMLKDAIKGIEMFWTEEKTLAQYDPESRKIELNQRYYENKDVLLEETNSCISRKWHPEGTDHNSHIVHEMGHALDFYASEVLYGEERVVFGHGTASRKIWREDKKNAENAGKPLKGEVIMEGLSAYAAASPHEYFAEAFSEVACSPNPRPMAKGIWQKFEVYMNEAQEKQQKGESRVGKSFFDVIQKFNPYHDPKTGRFTTAQGGGGIMAAVSDSEYAALMAEAGLPANYAEIKAKRKAAADKVKEALPNVRVKLSGVDADLATETAETIKTVVGKYPNCKDAFSAFVASDNEDRIFEKEPKTIAFFEANSKEIRLNPNYYGDKEHLDNVYKKTVEQKFHPEGTSYNALIVHEMAHALDTYASTKKGYSVSADIKKTVHAMHHKSGGALTPDKMVEGLSGYATVNHREFFAEAMAEYLTSPNPRPIAKTVGQMFDRMASRL